MIYACKRFIKNHPGVVMFVGGWCVIAFPIILPISVQTAYFQTKTRGVVVPPLVVASVRFAYEWICDGDLLLRLMAVCAFCGLVMILASIAYLRP